MTWRKHPSTLIEARLKRHQKQALTFMLRREQGWTFDVQGQDIWEAADTSQGRFYINHISETDQTEPPPQFCGGIIADPMGLGKTLTMISLIAHDLCTSHPMVGRWNGNLVDKPHVAATLIVVPQPLLGVWKEQLKEHVVGGKLCFRRHHAKSRLDQTIDINAVNIVLTTYHTLAADWKIWKASKNHIVFAVHWRRVILDEAHVIRNIKSRLAQAICGLDATSRWAVTGAPIQNNLSDLAALLKFIRAYPYNEPKRFDADITKLWKSGKDKEAVTRLKRLSRCLILRRANSTVDLPTRRDTRCPVNFSRSERTLYDSIREQTIAKIDDALLNESELSISGKYVNFLQQIESLRLVCNLGMHYITRHDKAPPRMGDDWTIFAQELFNIQRGMGIMCCSQCSTVLEHDDTILDELSTQESPLFSRCLKYACADCSYKLKRTGRKMACGDAPLCPVAPVSISNNTLEETPRHLASDSKVPSTGLPSKIEVLIADLKTLPPDVKWYVFLHLCLQISQSTYTVQHCILYTETHTRHHRGRPCTSKYS
jgi:SNF2 family DNA or RNA helicase